MEINYAVRWIVIYLVDSAIQRLNNRAQMFTSLYVTVNVTVCISPCTITLLITIVTLLPYM